jgi:23S rRNA (adenine2503-C2)-methyltransferase
LREWRPSDILPPLPELLPLQALLPEELVRRVPDLTIAEARAVVSTVHRDKDPFFPNPRVRRVARDAVSSACALPSLEVVQTAKSALDPFQKLVLRTSDERLVESVRIPLERPGRFSVCVSSQVGCALACAFCATGRLGLTRNLETWEIVEQVRAVRRTLDPARGERVHGVVFQGMGEPLANAERVVAAIRVLTDPSAGAIDARNVTVCTAGLPAGIALLARELPRVRLGWSIGSAAPGKRRSLMPIDGAHPLEDVFRAGVLHAKTTELAPLWAVTLLAGVNDGADDARALGELAARFTREAGRRPRISVIPYNRIADDAADPFRRVTDEAERRFRETVHALGTFTHKRYSGGSDVAAACGQLAARV